MLSRFVTSITPRNLFSHVKKYSLWYYLGVTSSAGFMYGAKEGVDSFLDRTAGSTKDYHDAFLHGVFGGITTIPAAVALPIAFPIIYPILKSIEFYDQRRTRRVQERSTNDSQYRLPCCPKNECTPPSSGCTY